MADEQKLDIKQLANWAAGLHNFVRAAEHAKDVFAAILRVESQLEAKKRELCTLEAEAAEVSSKIDTAIAKANADAQGITGKAEQDAERAKLEAVKEAERIKERLLEEHSTLRTEIDALRAQKQMAETVLATVQDSIAKAQKEHSITLASMQQEQLQAESDVKEAKAALKQAQDEYGAFLARLPERKV